MGFGEMSAVRAFQFFQILRQGGGLLGSVILAHSALSVSEIGIFESYLYVQYALTFFWVTGLIQAFLSYYPTLAADKQSEFAKLVYWVLLAFSVAGLLLLSMGNGVLLRVLTGRADFPYWGLFLGYLGLNTSSFLLEYVLLVKQKGMLLFSYALFVLIGSVLAIGIPIYFDLGLFGVLLGLFGFAGCKQMWLLHELGWLGLFRVRDTKLLRHWGWLSLPLIAYTFIGGLMPTWSGWLVQWHMQGDPAQFALFRYGAREFPLTVALAEALNAALIPILASDLRDGLKEVRVRTEKLLHLLFPITMLLMGTSRWWFPLVFSTEFEGSVPVFNAFLLITCSRLIFPKSILIALRDNHSVLLFTILELAFLGVLGRILLPCFGLAGMAMGVSIAYLLEKCLQVVRLKRRHGISPGSYIPLGWWIGYSAVLLAVYGSTYW